MNRPAPILRYVRSPDSGAKADMVGGSRTANSKLSTSLACEQFPEVCQIEQTPRGRWAQPRCIIGNGSCPTGAGDREPIAPICNGGRDLRKDTEYSTRAAYCVRGS